MARFEREQAAIRRGDLRDALALLRAWQPASATREDRAWHRALLADVLLFTAQRDEAVRLATLLVSDTVPAELTARAHVVRATVRADAGDLGGAVDAFRRALAAARDSGIPAELARTQVRLLSALAGRLESGLLGALVPDIRPNVLRAGDAHITAYFYIVESRLEAKAGAIDSAWHHLDMALTLLRAEPNHVLDALHAHAASALCSLTSDRTQAVAHARRALHAARQAGYTRLVPGILGNLAQALVHLGHLGEAETLVDEALAHPTLTTEAELGLLDTKAQASLLRRDVVACRALLSRIEERTVAVQDRWDWAALSRRETRVRLALACNEHEQAALLAAEGRTAALERGDAFHAALFALLEADARLTAGDTAAARALVEASVPGDDSARLMVAAERERVRARLAVYAADRQASLIHARRARRLIEAVGTAEQRDVLSRQLPEAFEAVPPTVGPRVLLSGLARRPDGSLALPLDLVNHLIASALRPTVFAQELAEVLGDIPTVRRVVMTIVDESGRGRERVFFGPAVPEADWRGVTWVLGPTREGQVSLHVWVTLGAGEAAIAALGQLVMAATSVIDTRRRASVPPPLWSDEPLSPPMAGVFGPTMRSHLAVLERAAATTMPVLVTGETGTGKELVAREVHRLSRAATGAFVPFNCAAIPREMMESQLFGHRRGAFTGATSDFAGVIPEAAGGTLFLDEIGQLDLGLQPKLLRFLESGEVQRLGEARPVTFDVRTISATNADIEGMVAQGGFREDLFYRLNLVRFHLPPLRERREDIPALARHFLERCAREIARPPLRLTSSAVELLTLYDWPGNVRELLNEMRRLTAFAAPGEDIAPEHLSKAIRTRALAAARRRDETVTVDADQPLPDAIAQLERLLIARAFRLSQGRVGEAASLLGISRKGLFLMRRRLGLD